MFTSNSKAAYIAECQQNGVPLPLDVLDSSWVNHGEVKDEFLSPQLEAELWSWTSTSPRGICLALPRWNSAAQAVLFGVICMGQQSGKVCFFDNPSATFFARNQPTPLSDFVGGAELESNGGGTCSNCHAGENPFLIHPEKEAFKSLSNQFQNFLMPANGWYRPIIPAGWPANPGPTNSIVATGGGGSCVACHKLPEVSELESPVEDYCDMVELATTRAEETMPPRDNPPLPFPTFYGDRRNQFKDHIDYIKVLCSGETFDVGEDVFLVSVDNPNVLSPPWVQGPLFACSNSVKVSGVLAGASAELFRRDSSGAVTSEGTVIGGPFGDVSFLLQSSVQLGDVFWAVQSLGSQTSSQGREEPSQEYSELELPAPRITQPVYACADQIGVHTQLQGVEAQVWKNSSSASWVPVPGTWNGFSPPPVPWTVGDTFHAQTRLCQTSSPQVSVLATPTPTTLKSAQFWTPPGVNNSGGEIFEGQEYLLLEDLDNGAFASVSLVQPSVLLGNTTSDPEGGTVVFHLPTSRLGRNAKVGDTFSAIPQFACGSSLGNPTTSTGVLPCSSLPAPRIVFPREGDRFITLRTFVPGARIRVYRASTGAEIADGAGPRVMLAPPNVLGAQEKIRVVQQLGTCVGTQAFEVTTGGANPDDSRRGELSDKV